MMKPMLASPVDLSAVRYPVYASPKIDGVRGLVIDGTLRSRSLKAIPNRYVSSRYSRRELSGFDGELILGAPAAKDVYRVTNSALARHDLTPAVTFYAFDLHDSRLPFEKRLANLTERVNETRDVLVVPHSLIENEADLMAYEEKVVGKGFEGLILRCPQGPYKFGRSSVREGWMLKLKRFLDSEAEILEVIEEMHNGNVAKTNALGRTERSSHQANLVGKGSMGSLLVRDVKTGVEFNVGTGFTAEDRANFWSNADRVIGLTIKYKYFPVGVKDKPRHPVYLGMRAEWDQ